MDKRKKDKRTNNELPNTTQKTKYQATRTPLKPGGELVVDPGTMYLTRQHYRKAVPE